MHEDGPLLGLDAERRRQQLGKLARRLQLTGLDLLDRIDRAACKRRQGLLGKVVLLALLLDKPREWGGLSLILLHLILLHI